MQKKVFFILKLNRQLVFCSRKNPSNFSIWKDEAGFVSISLDAPKVRFCTQRFSKEIIKFCYIISPFVSVPLTERKICKGFSFFNS
ncbi:hypothetical protein D6T69_15855 [Tenacibaculum singaporense]|uniref:Uncharacterized protein n=1 Tax=Tenacibaculum singaporense TaxID=2358479 RepID=A0A3Q8RQA6_9FLAO|nr:hypothetical protein D6T69_15855 [Tenacibaculum singaporense]